MSMPSKKKLGAFAAAGLVVVGGVTNSEQFEKLPFLRPDPTPVKTIGQLAVATVDADVGMLTKWQLEKGKPMKTDVGTFGDHDIRIKAVASDVDAGDAVSDTNTGYEVDLSKVKLDFAPVSRKTNPEIPEVIRDYPTPPPGQPNANEFKRLYEKNLGFVNRLPDAALIDEITGKTERTIDGTKVGRAAVIGWVEEALRERHHLGDETTITFVNPDKFAAEAQGNQYLARYVEIAKADGKDYSQAQQEVDIYRADKLNAAEGARKLPISTSPDVSDVKVKILGD
ncbi:hypothetical protein CR983_01230 [Candidatus Saccharibacteria bacterium]|nr:MAG: hypothetical protein CR983_01230 [Candidatus Saccharibacteria bacterium]